MTTLTIDEAVARFARLFTRAKRQHAKRQKEAATCTSSASKPSKSPVRVAA